MNALFRKLFIRHQSEAASAEAPAGGDAGGAAGGAEQSATTQTTDGAQGENQPGAEGEQSKPDAEGEGKPGEEKAPDGEKKPDEKKPEGAPEKYEFAAPEGSELDKEALEHFEPIARELNLNQEQAQKLVDLYGKEVMPKLIAKQAESWQKQTAEWAVAAKDDKEIGGEKFPANLEKAKQAMDKFANPELRTYLEESGLGNHPELIRLMVNVGRAMSEDTLVTSNEKGQRSAADVLYGKN
ncbi:hypothetical protein [Pantoea sp. GM01]|uniref:hypothetical protein n=1 Tax=Pantoea sp. GM01 TaxID=1144320 RepID=UPI0002710770|nr:hypothetical protein [Pantoea sp. GM01]EJL90266.1 hypothetical protein PMI17_01786 [Pantoea sp. GM01]